MEFIKQVILKQQINPCQEIFSRHNLDQGAISNLKPLIEHFEIRLPFIGSFSSGKSTLINALLKEPLLSTDISPETAVATELRYAPQAMYSGEFNDGKKIAITREQIENNQLDSLIPDGWLSVALPNQALAANPHLVLVDMPGWGSGVEAHGLVIDKYINRSLAYVVVVSSEEGTIREHLRKALSELALHEKPVILVVSKTDKKPENEVQEVANSLQREIKDLMGAAPTAVVLSTARKRDVSELEQALAALEKSAEVIFDESIVFNWANELQRASGLLSITASTEFQNAELINAEIESFEQKMQEFDIRLANETAGLEERVGPMLGAIRLRVENALNNRLDSLTDRAISGSNISDDILGTARICVQQALKEEFEPTMSRYLDRIVDALPSKLDFSFTFGGLKGDAADTGTGDFRWKAMGLALAPVLLRFSNPIGMVVATLLPFFGHLFDNKADTQRQEIEEARQREKAKSQVRSALSQAAEQIEATLRPNMEEQIQKAKAAVEQSIATERADVEKTLNAKREALQLGEEEAAAIRATAQADLETLKSMLAKLG